MYSKILLPVDLEANNSWQKALPTAIALARHYNAKLHVLTVVPEIVQFGAPMMIQYFPSDWEGKLVDHAKKLLEDFAKNHLPGDLGATWSVARGSIYGQILAAAETMKIDLIVMASHRPELKDYLSGPNAAHVVRHASCSVFVVRG